VILYHIVPGQVLAAEARTLERAPTVHGSEIRIRREGDQLRMNEATVRVTDILASNGVIHGIDRVLMPPEAVRK
jgi:transforming growth factor-beta-induced protein